MMRVSKLAMCGVLFAMLLSNIAAARTWTDRTDRYSVEAELIDLCDGQVSLKKADATMISVPLEQLSAEDLDFLYTLQCSCCGLAPIVGATDRDQAMVDIACDYSDTKPGDLFDVYKKTSYFPIGRGRSLRVPSRVQVGHVRIVRVYRRKHNDRAIGKVIKSTTKIRSGDVLRESMGDAMNRR